MQTRLNLLLILNIALLLLTITAVIYLDRPLALYIHQSKLDSLLWLRISTEWVPVLLLLSITFTLILINKSWLQFILLSLYIWASLQITLIIKIGLKVVFGRYWPKTWLHDNLSLINNNVYGFNWWHGFNNMGSFPSGHTTYTYFCLSWLIYLLPQFKKYTIVMAGFVPIALIILDYHFLGDCLAGIILGMDCGILSILVYCKFSSANGICHFHGSGNPINGNIR